MHLHKLPARDDEGDVRVVVEAPRGSGLKLKYEPSLGAFEHGRMLPLGLTYPYDWGFVPGTKAEDGDPLDALVNDRCPVVARRGDSLPAARRGAGRGTRRTARRSATTGWCSSRPGRTGSTT